MYRVSCVHVVLDTARFKCPNLANCQQPQSGNLNTSLASLKELGTIGNYMGVDFIFERKPIIYSL